jgi:DNA-binding LacI/PurR family transcriptional regulator
MEAVPPSEERLGATITEVAREAGVGVGTVSRVVNGSGAVRDQTRRRVLEAIDRLGYTPNAAARALSTGRTGAIGVVAPFFTRPSVIERLRGVAHVMSDAGYQVVLYDVERPGQRASYFGALASGGQVDAVLGVSLCPDPDDLCRFAAAGTPVVLVDYEHPDLPCVVTDDVAGGRMATEHLLGLGHERIAFVGDDEESPFGFTSSARRRRGHEEALAAAGIVPDEALLVRPGHPRPAAKAQALALLALDPPPTAVFAASDEQAMGVLDAASSRGVRVPRELSVVGFDDVEAARWAGLTTVSQPLRESGERGAEMLLDAMAGRPVRTRVLGLRLVRRATSGEPDMVPGRSRPPEVRNRNHSSTRGSSCRSV